MNSSSARPQAICQSVKLLLPVDCCEIEHTTIIYRCLSVVVCKEKLRLDFLGSYDSVGDGHFVVIDRVEKVLEEILFSSFYSFIRLDIPGR